MSPSFFASRWSAAGCVVPSTTPYTHSGEAKKYLPDFLVRLQEEGKEAGSLILETKGFDPLAGIKQAAARRWLAAVNADGSFGRWAYRLVKHPTDTPEAVRSAANELAQP